MISLTIDQTSDADQRIDKFLRKYLPKAPLGALFKWLRTGKIKVNGKRVEQNYRIALEDRIELFFTEEEIHSLQDTEDTLKKEIFEEQRRVFPLEILYEDEYLMVINKHSGVNVHPGDHKGTEVSLIEQIQDALSGKYNTLTFRPSLVHRIDRDTSGCILVAKEKGALESLLEQLQNGKIEKIYHAIILGTPEKEKDTINKKLLRIENAQAEAKVQVDDRGQTAITHYKVLKKDIHQKYSLVECRIETGRTHQIRVHLASLGNPLLGDKSYGDKKENSFAKRAYNISRQLLHAECIIFRHPYMKKTITLHAPYEHDMISLLGK